MNPWIYLAGGSVLALGVFVIWMLYRPQVPEVIKIGEPAPDFEFPKGESGSSLSELWGRGTLAVIWLRHYG